MTCDKLENISVEDLPKLQKLFTRDWPKYGLGYGILKNYYNWYQKDPQYSDAKIYCLNGDWSDGTFVVIDKQALFAYTVNEDLTNLRRLMDLVPPMKQIVCSAVYSEHVQVIQNALLSKNLKEYSNVPCMLYYIPKEKALEYDATPIPGTVIRELTTDNVAQIHKIHAFGHLRSQLQFSIFIKFNINVGLFDSKTGELMAWCLRYPNGMLNALQVEDKHKRKGYAALVVKIIAKKLAENGDDTFATIVFSNIPSKALFEKLGFIDTGRIMTWMDFKP